MSKHILLCSVGDSPAVVLEIIDWIHKHKAFMKKDEHKKTRENHDKSYNESRNKSQGEIPKITSIRLIGTKNSCLDEAFRLANRAMRKESCQIFSSIINDTDNDKYNTYMSEFILRVILDAKREVSKEDAISICLAGGRKTMSSYMQLGASLFLRPTDMVWHVVSLYNNENTTLCSIREEYDSIHPIKIDLFQGLEAIFCTLVMKNLSMPLEDCETKLYDRGSNEYTLKEYPLGESIEHLIEKDCLEDPSWLISKINQSFAGAEKFIEATMQGGALFKMGVHDVGNLVVPGSQEVDYEMIGRYVSGIFQLGGEVSTGKPLKKNELETTLCEAIRIIDEDQNKGEKAISNGVVCWKNKEGRDVRLEVTIPEDISISAETNVLRIIFRNLCKNISDHGKEEDEEICGTLDIKKEGSCSRIESRNGHGCQGASKIEKLSSSSRYHLEAFTSGKPGNQGVGLYAVNLASEKLGGHCCVKVDDKDYIVQVDLP